MDSNLLFQDFDSGKLASQENITWETLKKRIKRSSLRKEIETSLKEKGEYVAIAWGTSYLKISIINP